jgi:hypothetical protein
MAGDASTATWESTRSPLSALERLGLTPRSALATELSERATATLTPTFSLAREKARRNCDGN